jgi:hypothetical protein
VAMDVVATVAQPIALGNVYVLVVDPITFVTKAQAIANSGNGAYVVPQMPVGLWLMAAGPDLDGDGIICGLGEPCGLFPLLSDPLLVGISAQQIVTGIDFPVADAPFLPASVSTAAVPLGGFRLLP